jgi:enterochelin esterase-like enzyme
MTVIRFFPAAAAVLLLGFLGACGGGGSGDAAPAPVQSSTRTSSAISSSETGITYNYQVYLPPGYASGTARYPVVYAADGEYRFPVLADQLEFQRREVILVNVWHMGAARRFGDFTMPGAEAYYRFLTRELIPSIDGIYRTDPSRRVYSGHSLSGEFAMYALYLERPGQRHFSAFISGDGSFWDRPDGVFEGALNGEPATAMERQMFERDRDLPVSLVLAGSNQANGPRVAQVHEHLAGRGYTSLRLRLLQYSSGHLEMDGPSFGEGITFIFGP